MSNAIFEDVAARPNRARSEGARDAIAARDRARVRVWLMVLMAMVVIQIMVGALTRITDSGLSIVEWRPVTGMIPPLTEQ
ncbi:MAG: COX15/CtaA family protein, partial [Pseudomonadota bacterium]